MLDWLAQSARANPLGTALEYAERRWTYTALGDAAGRMGGWLAAQGVRPAARVAVLMDADADTVVLIHALIRIGAVLVPLNTRLTSDELAYQVTLARVDALVYAGEHHANTAAALPCPLKLDLAGLDTGAPPLPPRVIDLAAPQAIIFTSGTSGRPKGVVLTYANQYASAVASAFRIGTLPSDRWLCVLPLYHVGGLAILLRSALYGTGVILQRGFDVAQVNAAVDTGATLVSLVPTMLYRLLAARTAPPPASLRLILLGGAAADPELVRRCQALNIPIATTYGLTEACSQVATQTAQATERKPGSVGRAVPGTHIRVLTEAGTVAASGEYGEIVVSGPTVMQGYFDNPQATSHALREGTLHTGDIGCFDEEGDLWIVQRRSDLIVTGGENVYPAEVEAVLRAFPNVQDACVVGIADAEWGQRVAAAVMPVSGAEIAPEELLAFARGRLAGYKVPRVIRLLDALPLTASGKIERRAVQELLSRSG
jgi:O-succinylbenzoic acid--CoA ligase